MQIEVKDRMHQIRADCAERSGIQRHRVAGQAMRQSNPFRPQPAGIDPPITQVQHEKDHKSSRADYSIIAEKLKVIVVHVDRIALHLFRTEFAAVKLVGAASGAEQRIQFPLLDGGPPEIETHVFIIENVFRSFAQVVALVDQQSSCSQRQHRCGQSRTANPDQQTRAGCAQDRNA